MSIAPLTTDRPATSAAAEVTQRPVDRSAHPAGRDHPSTGPRPTGSMSVAALRAIAAGLARVQQPVPPEPGADGPRSVRLLSTVFYDVWLITWPDGTGLEPHDHGDTCSVMYVVDGEVHEDLAGSTAGSTGRTLRRSDSTTGGPFEVHGLRNGSGAEVTTLHVYSPPLMDVTFHGHDGGGDPVPLRSTPVVARPAVATSPETAPPRAPHLTLVDR